MSEPPSRHKYVQVHNTWRLWDVASSALSIRSPVLCVVVQFNVADHLPLSDLWFSKADWQCAYTNGKVLSRPKDDICTSRRERYIIPTLIMLWVIIHVAVENRVLRTEHIIMGTSGTVLDWVLKRKVWTLHTYLDIQEMVYVRTGCGSKQDSYVCSWWSRCYDRSARSAGPDYQNTEVRICHSERAFILYCS